MSSEFFGLTDLIVSKREIMLKILLGISIVLQLFAALAAVSLIRRTKYNVAWIFFTVALSVLCFIRLTQLLPQWGGAEWQLPPNFIAWLGVLVSFFFAVGVIFVREIFNYIDQLEKQRILTERRILTTVLQTEEKERQRLAKELHDGLGPLLSTAKMSLSALAKEATEENSELFGNTIAMIDEAVSSVREISNNLSPHTLQHFGLAKAVRGFLNKIPKSPQGVDIEYKTNLTTERFDDEVEVILYRVVCELVNNSMRHSGCSKIVVSLAKSGPQLTLRYADNGVGFDVEKASNKGMGLSNIYSRIRSLKGDIEIVSEKGKGVKVNIKVNV